jgi:hypothetical protein
VEDGTEGGGRQGKRPLLQVAALEGIGRDEMEDSCEQRKGE